MNTKLNKIIVGFLLFFTASTISAQNVVNRIEVPAKQVDTTVVIKQVFYQVPESTSKSYAEERGMISRDASKSVFIPKGQWMLGGQIAWNQWNNENLNYLVLKDINFEGYTFSAGPYLGYFFTNNMGIGV